jgi:acyl-CoA dehydrogenase
LYIDRFGNDDLKTRYLSPSIAGDLIGALAVTEPGAGSDVNALATRAVSDGDDWVINGSKTFITNGSWADYLVVATRTSDDAGHDSLTLFVVDADSPGLERNRMSLIAWHTSHTGELYFDDVRVADGNRLGDIGAGFAQIMGNFQWERVTMALAAVALAELSLETAIAYARERNAFGHPVIQFQVWQHRFADLAVRIRTSKALAYRALRLHIASETGMEVDRDQLVKVTSMAKLHSQRLAWQVADECVQVHGGSGALMEYRAQRLWRDARVGPIGGGTDDIMRNIIARAIGL